MKNDVRAESLETGNNIMNVKKQACCILNTDTFSPLLPLSSNPTPSQASFLRQEKENQDRIALELQRALQNVIRSQEADEEPEPIKQDSKQNTYDLLDPHPVEVVKQEASKSDEFEVCRYFCCVIC